MAKSKSKRELPFNALPPRPGFSLWNLILLVVAFAILFAATRQFFAYGWTLGCYAVWAVAGRMGTKRHWQFGALCGSIVLLLAIPWTWYSYGTIGQLDRSLVWRTAEQLKTVSNWLQYYERQHGEYPEKLSQLTPTHVTTNQINTALDAEKRLIYRKTGTGYVLTAPGRDRQIGGDGWAADVTFDSMRQWENTRVGFREFLLSPPHSNGCAAVLILSLVVASATSVNSIGQPHSWKIDLFTLLMTSLGATVIAGVMAGLYIAGSQSSH